MHQLDVVANLISALIDLSDEHKWPEFIDIDRWILDTFSRHTSHVSRARGKRHRVCQSLKAGGLPVTQFIIDVKRTNRKLSRQLGWGNEVTKSNCSL
jgi:hypothetical protein